MNLLLSLSPGVLDLRFQRLIAHDDAVFLGKALQPRGQVRRVGHVQRKYSEEVADHHQHQRVVDGGAVNHGGIRQHRHLGTGAEAVAQLDGIADDGSEVGVACGLAVAGKGQNVGPLSLLGHLAQLVPQGKTYILTRR